MIVVLPGPVSIIETDGLFFLDQSVELKADGLENELELCPIGLGMFPKISNIRHSCAQNTVRFFKSNKQVLAASRIINEGEEIVINRLVNLNSTIVERHFQISEKCLKKNAVCDCEACVENWPPEISTSQLIDTSQSLKMMSFIKLEREELKLFQRKDASEIEWLDLLRQKSRLLSDLMTSEEYAIHGATNPEILKSLLYVYQCVRNDPVKV